MTDETDHVAELDSVKFSNPTSQHSFRRLSNATTERGQFAASLKTLFIGIAAARSDDDKICVALAAHDTTYLMDFTQESLPIKDGDSLDSIVTDYVISTIRGYEHGQYAKFIGAGLSDDLEKMCPSICSRLWLDTDIVPIAINVHDVSDDPFLQQTSRLDEQADSMARQCIRYFGPSLVPYVQVGWSGAVQVDAGFQAHINTVEDHQKTCAKTTWDALMHYTSQLKDNKTKIAFFSSTPQGGGVALMRHALVRFSRLLGVDLTWYVPKPRPGVFRSTKNMHNILQGVADPGQRLSEKEQTDITDWITDNAKRYWLSKKGPLRPPEEGGAHVIIIDDPQMPGLIPLIKEITPDRPVLYRSHIQIRSDLVAEKGSPQAEVWQYLWNNISKADMFISHPIPKFVPHNVPRDKVAYLPATTDWLDGLNKPLSTWVSGYYGHNYNTQCDAQRMTTLDYPARKYIIQVARFDPAKGIPTVIDSYAEFRKLAAEAGLYDDEDDAPQLVVAGNSSIDDPDVVRLYDETMDHIEANYPQLAGDMSIMRLDANDQMLNMLIRNAHVVLQLSTREGFEVKVSEALHAGRPVIATKAGGIPLQVKDHENGFLVEPGDHKAVAGHLLDLFRDEELWSKMSKAAQTGVSDEVGTPGNALGWYYLAAKYAGAAANKSASKEELKWNEKWVNDLARDEAGVPYEEHENKLPRRYTQKDSVPLN